MKISYRILSLAMMAVCITLALILLTYPDAIYWLFGIEGNDVADFISRRAVMFLIGFAVMCYASRDAEPSTGRRAIVLGMLMAMVGLAVLGIVEFARGFAGIGILVAVVGELVLAAGYFAVWQSDKKLTVS